MPVRGRHMLLLSLLQNQNSTLVTALRFIITTVFAFIGIFVLGKWSEFRAPHASELIRFIVIALSTGMVALLIYYRGLKFTPVRVSTILELTFPFVAVLIDVFFYHVVLDITQYIAGIVLLFAMYKIANLQQKNEI